MAGHSKWSKVKHIKGPLDVERGAQCSKPVEAYAPGGVAMVIEDATDNKNRLAADLRLSPSKNSGSVSYVFHKKGQITVLQSLTDGGRI